MTDFATTDLFVSSLDHEIETRKLTVAERADRAKARMILMQSREYVIEMYLCRRYKYNDQNHTALINSILVLN